LVVRRAASRGGLVGCGLGEGGVVGVEEVEGMRGVGGEEEGGLGEEGDWQGLWPWALDA